MQVGSVEPFDEWDAGDLGCGDLLIILRGKIQRLPAGSCFKLIALDPGAIEDMPAWCNLTRHKLLVANHPLYLIQKRND